MKKFTILFCLLVIIFTSHLNAQNFKADLLGREQITLGIGGGFDYGGLGANLLVYPSKNFGLFVGVGYALAGAGVNAGVKYRFVPKKETSKVDFYLTGMYGYNTVIIVGNTTKYNKFFYGPSIGCGIDIRSNPFSRGYWTIGVLVPIRSSEVIPYINDLKAFHGVKFNNDLLPIGLSIGYRIFL